MPEENREVIRRILRGKEVSFFEAVKSRNAFEVEIKESI